MTAILSIILPLLMKLPGALGDYFKGQQEITVLKQKAEIELQKANIELSKELAQARLDYQKASLKATGKKFKYFTFVLWFGPYMSQILYPPLGRQIFENMAGMPEWYAQSCVAIMFTVWGISVSAPVVANIFSGLGRFFRERQDYKIKKAEVDRKVFFDGIRKLFPKGLNKAQVQVFDDALDKGEK